MGEFNPIPQPLRICQRRQVIFDNIAWYDSDCANGSEPDIAGVGVSGPNISRCQRVLTSIKVVISFVLASAMTTAASVLAMILDNAYDSKGQFTLHAPIKYIRERSLDTEWKKDYAWRPFLDPLIIGFGDQQLVTGYAVLLSAWIKVRLPDHTLRCFKLTIR